MTAGTAAAGFLDFFDPDFHHHAPEVAAAREAHWYARTPLGVAVLRYAEAAELLPDARLKQGGVEFLAAQGITSGPAFEWMRDFMMCIEGEDHRRLRRLVSKAFTPRSIEALRPEIRRVTAALIRDFIDAGECEFMTAFANRLPAAVMMQLLGIPPDLHDRFSRRATDLSAIFSWNVAARRTRLESAVTDLEAAAADLIAARRRSPDDDLISALVAAEDGGSKLSMRELQVMITGLVAAAQDTTRCQFGLALATFAEHPGQWALLAANPHLGAQAVEEVMRVNPAAPGVWRVAATDFEHQDLRVLAGTPVTILVASAHTDPRVFGNRGFDISTPAPARQLTFGGGIHACLGMALARLEMSEALPMLATALGPVRSGEIVWPTPTAVYGPVSLPLTWRLNA